jgi:hypothetical protein
MVTFRFPATEGNEILRSGKIDKVFGQLLEELKPEAAYFYPVNGQRGGHLIVNMTEGTDVLRVGEKIWFGLNAEVEMTPVMAPEDIQKGLGEIQGIIQSYG